MYIRRIGRDLFSGDSLKIAQKPLGPAAEQGKVCTRWHQESIRGGGGYREIELGKIKVEGDSLSCNNPLDSDAEG